MNRLGLLHITVFTVALGACSSVPVITHVTPERPAQITTVHGVLTPQDSNGMLASITTDSQQQDVVRQQLAIEQAIDHQPITAGNHIRLLRDGTQSFPAIFYLIRHAHNNINMEYFILEDVEQGGVRLSDLLIKKRRQGVVVNIIYDSFGSDETPDGFFYKLRQAGVNLVSYNPLNSLDSVAGYAPDARDHRKILIVDGSIAITGGVNLSTTYLSGPGKSQPSHAEHDVLPSFWRDTDIEIKGPAVAELQKLFMAHWQSQKGPALAPARYYPALSSPGKSILHILGSSGDEGTTSYYSTLVSAIRLSTNRLWLHTAYFVPTDQEEDELIAAVKRGVDVRLILPETSDSKLGMAYQHASYGDLLDAGVKIYEIHGVVLHSKTVTIDGIWSIVGSSNFDHRSVILNDEVDTVVVGQEFAHELEKLFNDDLAKSRQISESEWESRGVGVRLTELYAKIWGDEL